MEPNKTRMGAGDVVITLGGVDYTLRPTLNAAQIISRQSGGIRGAIDSILRMDMDVIAKVVTLGLGPQQAKNIKNLAEAIWEAGLTDDTGAIIAKCVEYLHVLANGGRPVSQEARDDTENPQE